MEIPTPWLIFAVSIHGILGSFGEIMDIMINRLSSPLANFYNESIHLHYGGWLDLHQSTVITSFMENFAIGGSIFAVIFLIPKMDDDFPFGRKNIAVYFRSFFGVLAASLILLSKTLEAFELFALAQVFVGVIRALKIGVAKTYISDFSPDQIRGLVTQSVSTCSYLAIFISAILTLPFAFGNDERWHLQAALALLMALVFVVIASVIPESPKYLLLRGKNIPKVKRIIQKFHGKSANIDGVMDEYEHEFRITDKSKHTSYRSLWQDEGLRESLYLVLIASLTPTLGPLQIHHLYSVVLKIRFGFTNSQALLFDTVLSLFYAPLLLLLPYLYERVGRRPMFLLATLSGTIASALLFLDQSIVSLYGTSILTVTISGLYTFFIGISYALGVPVFYIILIVDLFPHSAKATATQAVFLLHNIIAVGVNLGYATFEQTLGPFIYTPFILYQLVAFTYSWHFLPETKGLPIYENFEHIRSQATTRPKFDY